LIDCLVYDSGAIFSPDILDIKPEDLRAKFVEGVRNIAAISLQIGYPTVASAPHSIVNGFKNLLAIAAVTDIEFEQAKKLKEYLKDPSKFAAATAAAAPAAAPAAKEAPKEKEKEKPKPKEEEEEEEMSLDLFG
jgi:large subunit ribosomal protein LP0